MGRPEFSPAIARNPSEDTVYQRKTESDTISDGNSETVTFVPSSGEIWVLTALSALAPGISGTGGNFHTLDIQPDNSLGMQFATAEYDSAAALDLENNQWEDDANRNSQSPDNDALPRQLRGIRINNSNGLKLVYTNGSGSDQTGQREYEIHARVINR